MLKKVLTKISLNANAMQLQIFSMHPGQTSK